MHCRRCPLTLMHQLCRGKRGQGRRSIGSEIDGNEEWMARIYFIILFLAILVVPKNAMNLLCLVVVVVHACQGGMGGVTVVF